MFRDGLLIALRVDLGSSDNTPTKLITILRNSMPVDYISKRVDRRPRLGLYWVVAVYKYINLSISLSILAKRTSEMLFRLVDVYSDEC